MKSTENLTSNNQRRIYDFLEKRLKRSEFETKRIRAEGNFGIQINIHDGI